MYIYIYLYLHTNIDIWISIYKYTIYKFKYTYTHIYIFKYMYIFIYVHILYVYINIDYIYLYCIYTTIYDICISYTICEQWWKDVKRTSWLTFVVWIHSVSCVENTPNFALINLCLLCLGETVYESINNHFLDGMG